MRKISTQRETFARYVEAVHIEEPPDSPHADWKARPNWNDVESRTDLTPDQKKEVYYQWHPPFGETHVEYNVFPTRQSDGSTKGWHTNHEGTYQGMRTIGDAPGNTWTHPEYKTQGQLGLSESLGHHATPEEGMRLAEQHYQQNYGQSKQSIGDYDINELMRDQGF